MDSRICNDRWFFFTVNLLKVSHYSRFSVFTDHFVVERIPPALSRYGMRSVCLDLGSFWRSNWQLPQNTHTDQYYRTHGVASERGL